MLPRFRNIAIAREYAEKISSGECLVGSYLYTGPSDEVEDPEHNFTKFDLQGLKEALIASASSFGYPSEPFNKNDASSVDTKLAAILYCYLQDRGVHLSFKDVADMKLWAFLNIGLIPELIKWRFGKKDFVNVERYVSLRRSYSWYLWISAWLFEAIGENSSLRWDVLYRMGVDSIVQIIERPGVGYNRKFALELGKQTIISGRVHKINESELIRGAMLRAKFTGAVIRHTNNEDINQALVSHLLSWSRKFYVNVKSKSE